MKTSTTCKPMIAYIARIPTILEARECSSINSASHNKPLAGIRPHRTRQKQKQTYPMTASRKENQRARRGMRASAAGPC